MASSKRAWATSPMLLLFTSILQIQIILADVPTNCMIEETYGSWTLHLSKPVRTLNCTHVWDDNKIDKSFDLYLHKPNMVYDDNNQMGHFTMIYNQGFQVMHGLHTYFAFFEWSGDLPYLNSNSVGESKYNCSRTMAGWAHNVVGSDYRCFKAVKNGAEAEQDNLSFISIPNVHSSRDNAVIEDESENVITMSRLPVEDKSLSQEEAEAKLGQPFKVDHDLLNRLDLVPKNVKTWESKAYEDLWNPSMTIKQAKSYQGMFAKDYKKMEASLQQLKADSLKSNADQNSATNTLFTRQPFNSDQDVPDAFDWRDVNGVNFVSPVRHQDMCGSCYIFASAGELEARIRIATMNKQKPILSTQQVVDCSPYSQGCEGGFPYLIAGKWAKDWGFVEEECYPYEGQDKACRDPMLKKFMSSDEDPVTGEDIEFYKKNSGKNGDCFSNRYYTAFYNYVGNYFGNCNEAKMKEEIFRYGPVSVGFMVLDDFRYYSGGIYQHTGLKSRINKIGAGFEETNHAVLVVGYGHCEKENLDYWIVKNSWGDKWGEEGYFKIVRGRDEVGIESMAQGSMVVPPY